MKAEYITKINVKGSWSFIVIFKFNNRYYSDTYNSYLLFDDKDIDIEDINGNQSILFLFEKVKITHVVNKNRSHNIPIAFVADNEIELVEFIVKHNL